MEPHAFPACSTAHRRVECTGADPATVYRQLPILHSCVPNDDEPVLLARANRPGDRASYLLLLTTRRLVVTGETRILRRQRLHLNADPRHLSDVLWTPEPTLGRDRAVGDRDRRRPGALLDPHGRRRRRRRRRWRRVFRAAVLV